VLSISRASAAAVQVGRNPAAERRNAAHGASHEQKRRQDQPAEREKYSLSNFSIANGEAILDGNLKIENWK